MKATCGRIFMWIHMAISIGKHVYIYVYLLASDRTESIGKHAYIYIYIHILI